MMGHMTTLKTSVVINILRCWSWWLQTFPTGDDSRQVVFISFSPFSYPQGLGFRWRPSFKAFRRNTSLLSHSHSFPQLLYQLWPAADLALATERKAPRSKTLAIPFHLKLTLKATINLDGSMATQTPILEILIVVPLV